jgi:hypothetical protein
MSFILDPLRRSVVDPLLGAFRQGLTRQTISLSFACGIVGGLFPIPFTTSVICFLFIYLFSLNVAICQVVNILMTPVQILVIIPFLRFGEFLIQAKEPLPLIVDELLALSLTDIVAKFGYTLSLACFGWFVFSIVSIPFLYFLIYSILSFFDVSPSPQK